MNLRRPSKKTVSRVLLVLIALTLVAIGVTYYQDRHKKPATTSDVITYSTDQPDENRPGPDYDWKGGPNDPKKIVIPNASTDAFIQKVGVDQHQAVGVPNNVHIAGWFVDSARPGDKGLSIIDGHVDGRTDVGVFEKLIKLTKGDTFTVELGNGSKLNYKVTDVVSVPEKEAAAILFSQDPSITSQLNLITCGGRFDRNARAYDNRVIVSAALQ